MKNGLVALSIKRVDPELVSLMPRFGDEYEFGVAFEDLLWTVKFRVRPRLWVNIYAIWDMYDGLRVMIDGAQHEHMDPMVRDYQQLTFDAFMGVVVGLNIDGLELMHEVRFEIAKLSIYDWTSTDLISDIDENMLWLGCGPLDPVEVPYTVPVESAVHRCRAVCSSFVVAVRQQECLCVELEATNKINSNISQCDLDTDWGYFSASGLDNKDSDYSIVVTTEILGDKAYVKPLEAIKIHIATNFIVDVPFKVDFGDNETVTEIYGKEVSHYWSKAGKYDITVVTEVGIAKISGTTDFTVEDVDEGYAGDFVMLDTFHGDRSRLANVDFTNIDYATGACQLRYGDSNGIDVKMLGLEEYVETAHTTHLYPRVGHYKLHVNCTNPYGLIQNSTFFAARKLDTTYHFHDKDASFATPFAGEWEFLRSVEVQHNDRDHTVSLNESNPSSFEIQPRFLRLQENFVTYNFEEVTLDKRIINVQNMVEEPEVFSPLIDGAWNLTTNITVRVPAGNAMFLNVSFSAGEKIFYIHYLENQTDIVFEVMFLTLGYYPVQANISNDISYSTADMLVSVEVPLRSISLFVTNVTDKEMPVELLIDLNEGMRGPMKVNFQIDQGNGYVDKYFYYSDKIFFATYRHMYKYPNWGIYDICVRAFNRISSVIECITVKVGQRIKYVDVTMPSAGRFRRNETTKSIIRCPKGSDKTYIVDFGDGETFVFTDRYLKETEHFEDTTTTTSTTTSTVAPTTSVETGNMTTSLINEAFGNSTTSTTINWNGTTDATTSSTTLDFETSTEFMGERRRREADNTGFSASDTDYIMFESTTQSVIQTTESSSASVNRTAAPSLDDSDTNSTTSAYGNTSVLSETDGNKTSSDNVTATSTHSMTTTTEMPTTTTTMFITSTMEPIPDDATNPYTTNNSFARRRRDGTIEVTHRYQDIGTYSLKVKAVNHFNWAWDVLCPLVVIAGENNSTCQSPDLAIVPKYASSIRNPLQFFRSEKINLTATVSMSGCGSSVPTFSWRTDKLVMENDRRIRRPYHDTGICVLETKDKIFQYPMSSLPFGSYVVTLVVSPSDHPLKTTMHEFFMDVNPSPPHAVIEKNDEHLWFLVYGTTMLKFPKSIDPDFNTHDGIVYDLVFMEESKYTDVKYDTRDSMVNKSSLVVAGITHKYRSKNIVRVYEYTPCFLRSGNLTKDMRFPSGEFNLPSEYFVSDVNSFAMILYVTKNNLTTSAHVTFEIRLSNASNLLDQLDDLLKSKDTTGVMRAVEALSATLVVTPTNSSEEEEFEAKEAMTELKTKLIGALDSVSEGVKDIDQASGMIGLVDDLTKDSGSVSDNARVGATSAIKNSAEVTESFADEPLDTLTGVGSKVVSGVSNVLPKEDEVAKKLAEHEKSLAQAEKDAKAALGPSDEEEEENPEEDGADITLEEDTDELTELTEEDLASNAPLPYNKLLKKCDLLHSSPLDKLYKYLFFYEAIFRHVLKNKSVEIMIDAEILKLPRNDIFCYIGVLEEPGDVEWYYNRYLDEEKRRRDKIRKDADRDVSKSFLGSIDSVSSVLLNKTEANQTVELGAPGLKVAMKKVNPNATEEDESMGDDAGVKMPAGVLSGSGNGSEVGQTLIVNDQSPFTYGNENDTTEVGTAVVTFKLSTPGTKDEVPVSNTTEPIEIYLAGNPDKVQTPMLNTLLWKKGDAGSSMNYHKINVTKNDTTIHVIVRPQFSNSEDLFDVLLQYEGYPNETHYLARTTVPHPEDSFSPNLTWEKADALRHTFFPDAELTKIAGIYRVGVKLRSGVFDLQQTESVFNYTFQMFLGGCRFWNHENETWDSDGCEVGNLTTVNATQCLCTHLTSFGGEMVVPPNTIDFNNVWAKFKDLNENAAVFSTIISLLGLYVIGLIWARYMDKKDLVKWGATPLEDNLPTDNYHYQISVYTGIKKGAGTKSNISFIISGEERDTGVRRMFDGKRKTHDKGSIMNYILSVEEKLGPLSFCRIWHDNSGEGKNRSWFLDQIEMSDLQTGERYFFLCNRWLACEEDDGMVDRILPVAGIEDLVAFKQLFSSSVRKKLTSDHLWLSVFSRPTRSSFTRVQRISCCMSLLFLTMITNAMWFKSDGEAEHAQNSGKQTVSLKIGPISFTLQQVFISLASTIIVFPPSFLLITFFRRTKQKKNTIMQQHQRKPKRGKWKNLGTTSRSNMWGADDEPKTSRFKKFTDRMQKLVRGGGNSKNKYGADDDEEFDNIPAPTIAGDRSSKKDAQKKKKKPYMFPHWFNYIAWILCFFSIITPAFFTILYSMQWGKEKANEWLITFVLSFFQSVIVVQPIKVLCLVAFIACVLKKPDLGEEGDCTAELNNAISRHEEEVYAKGSAAIDEIAKRRREANESLEPPDTEKLEAQRQARLKEMKMEEILKEIMIYGFFVLVLFFLSYQQRDLQSFYYTENMKNMFLGKYEGISTVLEYWVWLEKFFLPTLYAAKYHNGTQLYKWWDRRCLNDFESRRMGIARMRQFRIKEDSCKIHSTMRGSVNHCRNDYNWYDDDTKAYLPGWVDTSEENRTILDERRDDPFVYQNSVRLKSAPYVATLQTYKGGGYVVNFERSYRRTVRNLTRIRHEDWLDLRTRAIMLEFTVYNPNSNLFASAVMITEFPAFGAAVARSEFKIFRLQSYVGGFAIVVIFFEVLYCCFTIFFFVRCIKKVKKDRCKYFKTFWDILEFCMLCFAVACIAMYIFKHMLTEVAFHYLKKQSQPEFINFQSLAMYDEFYGYMTAIVVFLASIQFLKLLQFNKKMNMLGDTVKLATKDLKVFSIAFLLYFFAFAFTAYLLFGKHMIGYNGFVSSAESTFAFTLGAFDFEAMSDAHKFIGPIFFFLFIMVIYVGLMSIFLTIIADAFTTVKEDTQNAQNDYEMLDFVWRKFKGIIGVK
ncbi:uncharacterized protein LOC123562231 [Mercenaria mercenaria]|uniref:uncharacterized protein LOC123562231 n=1 Tax=Mercenaria mercenaria TaxID=6596 RepID=UPI00234FA373|nr:uncharacterized protein LOC123562231 [Mercenaria mercenaria]